MAMGEMATEAKQIRTVIVDDEPLGRTVIREMLRREPDFTVVGECANGHEAIASINAERPDLIFLDVQMPEVDGFEVLAALDADRLPLVIFVTAYDQYAVSAFEVHAVDYLLKPFDRERFGKALQRAKEQLQRGHLNQPPADVSQRILALLEEQRSKPKYLERLVIKTNGRIFFLKTDEIDWISAEGKPWALFDLQTDPGETRNVADLHPAEVERLQEAIGKWWRAPTFPCNQDQGVCDESRAVDKETTELLKSLGYL
jgi:DNA-binding LytR/AlgR family response regulator